MARLQQGENVLPIQQNVKYYTKRGAGIALLQRLVDEVEWEDQPTPDIILLFLGGNDLDAADVSPIEVARKYATEIDRLCLMGIRVMVNEPMATPRSTDRRSQFLD